MSITFNTDESVRWKEALSFNHLWRKQLGRFGLSHSGIGQSALKDAIKSRMWRRYLKLRGYAG